MQQLLIIALGGSAGAVTRFLVANGIYAVLGRSFPYATLFINVSGSFLIGFLTELLLQRFPLADSYRAGLLIGFLGAYTTFSTFALETFYLFETGNHTKAVLNILLSVLLCVAACGFGLIAGRLLFVHDQHPWAGQSVPHLVVAPGFIVAFLLAIASEIVFEQINATPELRTASVVLLLGALIMTSTFWLALNLTPSPVGFHGLSSLFVTTTLLGVIVVWCGSWLGHWLWQRFLG